MRPAQHTGSGEDAAFFHLLGTGIKVISEALKFTSSITSSGVYALMGCTCDSGMWASTFGNWDPVLLSPEIFRAVG